MNQGEINTPSLGSELAAIDIGQVAVALAMYLSNIQVNTIVSWQQ